MVATAHGEPYEAVSSLDEARNTDGVVVVLQGDDGGSIYLTCPARLVACDEAALKQLLLDLDHDYWNDPESVGLYYERASIGSRIAGGTGGGLVNDAMWLHPKLLDKHLYERAEAVLLGTSPSL